MNVRRNWLKGDRWQERIITADPSWFVVCMGSGIMVQLLTNFPWPAYWLRNLGYCYWILTIVLFVLFTVLGLLRLILYPKVARHVFLDFGQTSYLGTIPIALDQIIAGVVIFYQDRSGAVYATEGLFWLSVVLTALVVFIGVFVMYNDQGTHQLNEVNGVWLLSFIPMIVTAATGSGIAPHLATQNGISVLMVSFLMWSLGTAMSFVITTIYFWRLMACQLPQRDLIVSCFIPVGPLGMGAYAIQNMAVGLASSINSNEYTLQRPPLPPTDKTVIAAIAETVHWMGIIIALFLLALGTFWWMQAFASVWTKRPRSFNVGLWSAVFPSGVYANAFCILSTDLRNTGMKAWAAVTVIVTIILWLFCALGTVYKGLWKGHLFFAPSSMGRVEEGVIAMRKDSGNVEKGEKDGLPRQTRRAWKYPGRNSCNPDGTL